MKDFVFFSKRGKRDKQEDFYGNFKNELFLIADGLGGMPAGEVAAETAVKAVLGEHKRARKLKEPRKTLKRIFEEADRAVYEKAQKKQEWTGMGTTMVAVALQATPQSGASEVVIANVGDSRGYILARDEFVQVTKDHRVGRGPALTQALGLGEPVSLDIHKVEGKGLELVFLCTDGLTDFVKDSAIEKLLRSKASLKKKAEGLIELALQMGSTDNITVGLVKPDKAKSRKQKAK